MLKTPLVYVRNIKDVFTEEYRLDPICILTKTLHGFGYCRLGSLNQKSSLNISHKQDFFEKTDLSFQKVYDLVFNELIFNAQTEGKQLAVSWSGGIDSTSFVCELLGLGYRPLVLYNDYSVREYPEFIPILKEGFELNTLHYDVANVVDIYKTVSQKYKIIFGSCGECILGCDDWEPVWQNYYRYEPIDGFMRFLLEKNIIRENERKDVENLFSEWYYDEVIRNFKLEPLDNFREFEWLLKFLCKWNHDKYCNKIMLADENFVNSFVAPFTHPLLQNYCFTNYKKLNRLDNRNPLEYKPNLKNVIKIITGNTNYLKNKVKEYSYKCHLGCFPKSFGLVDENGNIEIIERYKTEQERIKYLREQLLK